MLRNCPTCGMAQFDNEERCLTDGVTVPSVFSGTLYWRCRHCGAKWHRFPPGDYRHNQALRFVTTGVVAQHD